MPRNLVSELKVVPVMLWEDKLQEIVHGSGDLYGGTVEW